MDTFIEVVKYLNLPAVFIVLVGLWFFLRDFKKEIRNDINEIHKEFKFINIRLSRVEGTVYGKDIYKSE